MSVKEYTNIVVCLGFFKNSWKEVNADKGTQQNGTRSRSEESSDWMFNIFKLKEQ